MNSTVLYLALLVILFVVLSVRTIRLRRSLKIAVGDAGNSRMLRAMRVHSNFSEYVPLAVLLIYFVESKSAHPFLVHSLGLGLFAGRISHAYGLSQDKENFKFRVTGMAITFTVMLTCAGYLLFSYFSAF